MKGQTNTCAFEISAFKEMLPSFADWSPEVGVSQADGRAQCRWNEVGPVLASREQRVVTFIIDIFDAGPADPISYADDIAQSKASTCLTSDSVVSGATQYSFMCPKGNAWIGGMIFHHAYYNVMYLYNDYNAPSGHGDDSQSPMSWPGQRVVKNVQLELLQLA